MSFFALLTFCFHLNANRDLHEVQELVEKYSIRRRRVVYFIRNQTMMNCNASENRLTILCHFFKFVIHSRSADVLLLIILDQEFTFA